MALSCEQYTFLTRSIPLVAGLSLSSPEYWETVSLIPPHVFLEVRMTLHSLFPEESIL